MARAEYWPHLFVDYISERMGMPFEWGKHDCVLFALGCARAITKESYDIIPEIEGQYGDAKGAARFLQIKFGVEKLDGFFCLQEVGDRIADQYGREKVDPKDTIRGDVCLVHGGATVYGLGVISHPGGDAVVLAKEGLASAQVEDVVTAWRV